MAFPVSNHCWFDVADCFSATSLRLLYSSLCSVWNYSFGPNF
jgi:hypothetical protein